MYFGTLAGKHDNGKINLIEVAGFVLALCGFGVDLGIHLYLPFIERDTNVTHRGLISESEVARKTKGYIIIAVWLAALSLIEVYIPRLPISHGYIALLLVVFATVKAGMVDGIICI